MTVVLPLRDADGEACRVQLERQRAALEAGFARVPGVISACLALLPADPELALPALFIECTFESDFRALIEAWFLVLGEPLTAVLGNCAEFRTPAHAGDLAEYLGARAQRSAAFAGLPSGGEFELELGRAVQRGLDALGALGRALPAAPAHPQILEDEARRSALAMQEPLRGVPLVHVAWIVPAARARLQRALRDLERIPAPVEYDVRFLLADARLVFVAYPDQSAARWSERLSRGALAPCTRIWQNCRQFTRSVLVRRARRERQLQQFVLQYRVPVGAWFNARAPLSGARREI